MKVPKLGFELGEKGADDVSPGAGKRVSSQKPRSHPKRDKASSSRLGEKGQSRAPYRWMACKGVRCHLPGAEAEGSMKNIPGTYRGQQDGGNLSLPHVA